MNPLRPWHGCHIRESVGESPKPKLGKNSRQSQNQTGQYEWQNHSKPERKNHLCKISRKNTSASPGLPDKKSPAKNAKEYSLLLHQECQPIKQSTEKQSAAAVGFERLQQQQRG